MTITRYPGGITVERHELELGVLQSSTADDRSLKSFARVSRQSRVLSSESHTARAARLAKEELERFTWETSDYYAR